MILGIWSAVSLFQYMSYIFFTAFNACLSVISKYTSFTPSILPSDGLRGCWATFILITTILLRHQVSGKVYFDYFSSNWFSLSFIVPLRPIGLLLISSCTFGGSSGIWTRDLAVTGPRFNQLNYRTINTEIGIEPIYPVYETGKTTSLPPA